MASSDKDVEEQLLEAGNKIFDPPTSVEELLPLLDVSLSVLFFSILSERGFFFFNFGISLRIVYCLITFFNMVECCLRIFFFCTVYADI